MPLFRDGRVRVCHVEPWDAWPNRNVVCTVACVIAWQFWTTPSDYARLPRRLQARRCGETGWRLWKSAEIDHRVPVFRVWSEHRDAAWPELLEYWDLPNLLVINRDAPRRKMSSRLLLSALSLRGFLRSRSCPQSIKCDIGRRSYGVDLLTAISFANDSSKGRLNRTYLLLNCLFARPRRLHSSIAPANNQQLKATPMHDPHLRNGLNVHAGHITNAAVARIDDNQ